MQAGEPRVEVLPARDVPLGGPRALRVRRTLPQRARTLIGAWCFADHYGPVHAGETGMDVPPYPHTGLRTVGSTASSCGWRCPRGTGAPLAIFQCHVPDPVRVDGAEITVFLGSLAGSTSPMRIFAPLLGAESVFEPHVMVILAGDPAFGHGLLVDSGDVRLIDTVPRPAELGYVPCGADTRAREECRRAPTASATSRAIRDAAFRNPE